MLTREGLQKRFQRLGIERGDALIVHSSFRSLGRIDGGADAVIDALLDVIGPDAEASTENHLKVRASGVGSPIDRFAARDGKVLLLGVGHMSNTTIHVAKEHAGIPKPAEGRNLPLLKIRAPG